MAGHQEAPWLLASFFQGKECPPQETAIDAGIPEVWAAASCHPKYSAGIALPRDAKGARSSTEFAKGLMAASFEGSDCGAAAAALAEKDWRMQYWQHFIRHAELGAGKAEVAYRLASNALQHLHDLCEFHLPDGTKMSLRESMTRADADAVMLDTASVRGDGELQPLRIPKPGNRSFWEGPALQEQIRRWATAGSMESSAAEALAELTDDQSRLDLRGMHFVLMGGGGQMAPTLKLLEWGATVYVVDIARPQLWQKLIANAKTLAGTLVFPIRGDRSDLARAAGADLLTEGPSVARWILQQAPGQRLVLGSYTYLDGEKFVRVAAVADAIVEAVCLQRPDVVLASLCSPTEIFVVPKEAQEEADRRLQDFRRSRHALWHMALGAASSGRYLLPNKATAVPQRDGAPLLVQDSAVWMQGPNYMLAKHVQRWRAVWALERGQLVSANVAPATLTASVMSNRIVAAGMLGCAHFGIDAFEPPTASAAMAALLVSDLAEQQQSLRSPLEIFTTKAIHGGTWRCAYKTNTYTEVSAVVYMCGQIIWPLAAAAGAAAIVAPQVRRRSKL